MGRKYKYCNREKNKIDRRGTHFRKYHKNTSIDYKKIKVEIKESALKKLQTFQQKEGFEIGGVFTGSELEESKFRIAKVSDPCTIFNGSTKYNCTRDARLANLFIEEDYKVSNRSRYYLGEWHTHPEDNPQPSNIDVASIKNIYSTSKLPINGVFLIIVGLRSNYYGFYDGKNIHKIDVTLCT